MRSCSSLISLLFAVLSQIYTIYRSSSYHAEHFNYAASIPGWALQFYAAIYYYQHIKWKTDSCCVHVIFNLWLRTYYQGVSFRTFRKYVTKNCETIKTCFLQLDERIKAENLDHLFYFGQLRFNCFCFIFFKLNVIQREENRVAQIKLWRQFVIRKSTYVIKLFAQHNAHKM